MNDDLVMPSEHSVARVFREYYNGKFPNFTSLGCYTIMYVTKRGAILCGDCATEETINFENGESDDPVWVYDTYDEGPDLTCEGCCDPIKPSYGNPDDNEEKSDNS